MECQSCRKKQSLVNSSKSFFDFCIAPKKAASVSEGRFAFSNLILRMRCRGRSRRRRVIAAVVGRENAEQKLSAHSDVGGVARGELQVGGVLNRQNVFVKRRSIGVLGRGGVFRSAGGQNAKLFGRAKGSSRGLKCRRLGGRPAFECQRGKVRGILHRGQNDVGASQI